MDHIAHPEEHFQLLLHFVLNNQFHVFFFLVNVDIETYLHKQVGTFDLFHFIAYFLCIVYFHLYFIHFS